jgi:hypothetical protein
LVFSVADFVSAAMANSERNDPDTWSLPSESGVKHGVATPTLIGLEDATPKEIQLDRAGIETEIEAELLRGVGLSIALSGFGVSDVILSNLLYDLFTQMFVFHCFSASVGICSEEGSTNIFQESIGNFHL